MEFSHIPFSGLIDQWEIGSKGITILSNSSLYHYPNPDSDPLVFNSEKFLELHGCIISDFSISGSKLYTLCQGKGIVHRFDLDSFDFETTLDLKVDASSMEIYGERAFLYQAPNTLNQDTALNFQVLTFPLSQPEKLKKYLPYSSSPTNAYHFNVLINQSLLRTENTVLFTRMLNDTLIRFNSAGDWVESESLQVLPAGIDPHPGIDMEQEQLYFPLYFFESDDWRWYSLLNNSTFQTLIHNLSTGKKTLIEKLTLPNGVRLPFLGQIFQEEIYVLVTEEAFIEFNQNDSYPDPFEKLRNYEIPFVFLRIPLSELASQPL